MNASNVHKLPQLIRVPVNELFLDTENPRHKPVETEAEAIRRLCETENVHALAADIAEHGLNPLEVFAVFPADDDTDDPTRGPFIVAEGNRRLCALKLLADPDSAPAGERDRYRTLVAKQAIETVPARLFSTKGDARLWLERLHSGELRGRGRKPWSAEQKTRFLGGGRHARAQKLLDVAQNLGLITEDERAGKLSVVDRWLSNPQFREALGIDIVVGADDLLKTRPMKDFRIILMWFIEMVKKGNDEGGITTRARAEDMKAQAREIEERIRTEAERGVLSGKRIDPEPLTSGPDSKVGNGDDASKRKRRQPKRIRRHADIKDALDRLDSQKLTALYASLTEINLDHAPVLSVAAWAFYEALTTKMGKDDNRAINAFMSHDKLKQLGFSEKTDRKEIVAAFRNITEYGNLTKHAPNAALFNGSQLRNDFEVLENVTLVMIRSISDKTPNTP